MGHPINESGKGAEDRLKEIFNRKRYTLRIWWEYYYRFYYIYQE